MCMCVYTYFLVLSCAFFAAVLILFLKWPCPAWFCFILFYLFYFITLLWKPVCFLTKDRKSVDSDGRESQKDSEEQKKGNNQNILYEKNPFSIKDKYNRLTSPPPRKKKKKTILNKSLALASR